MRTHILTRCQTESWRNTQASKFSAVCINHDSAIATRPSETRRGIASHSPQSVAYYIRGSQESNRSGDASKLAISEEDSLFQWATGCKKLYYSLEELIPNAKLVFQAEGFEHVVYHDQLFAFAVKLTRPGTFYLFGGILEYLDRLDYCNNLFGDEITIDGILQGEGDRFQIVTSQPWIPEDSDVTPPTLDEIEAYFEALMFQTFWLGPDNPAFYREDLDVVASDAHAGNFIRCNERLVPIDVIVGKPKEIHRQTIADQLGISLD